MDVKHTIGDKNISLPVPTLVINMGSGSAIMHLRRIPTIKLWNGCIVGVSLYHTYAVVSF